jgi:hypothetical protein
MKIATQPRGPQGRWLRPPHCLVGSRAQAKDNLKPHAKQIWDF